MYLPISVIAVICLFTKGGQAVVTSPPKNSLGVVGKSVTIPCTVTGGGLSWQFIATGGGLPVGIDTTSTTERRHVVVNSATGQYDLVINSVQQGDAGAYICQDRALNSKGMYLGVLTSEPSADVSHTAATPLKVGDTVTTTCKANFVSLNLDLEITAADGTKTETVTSTATNSLTPKAASRTFTQTAAQPNVPAVTCSYRFKLSPNAPADADTDTSTTSATTVNTQPLVIWECVKDAAITPVATMYKAGDKLTCTASGFPLPTFRWEGTASPAQTGANFTVPNTLTVGQSYTYKCIADNAQTGFNCPSSEKSVTFNLAACAAKPTVTPTKASYVAGDTITCNSVGFPVATYVWKDGSGNVLANTATYTIPSTLTLGQTYNYTCEATNNQQSFPCPTQATSFQFQAAKCSSNVTVTPKSDNYLPGATVTCTALGSPTPTLKWLNKNTGATVSTTGILTVPTGLTPGSTYNYQCVASNSPPGTTCPDATDDVTFTAAQCATSTQVTPEKVQYSPGETVTCSADGFPTPTYKWVDVDTGATVSTTATVTLPTDGTKSYKYRCESTNSPTGGVCGPATKTIEFVIVDCSANTEIEPEKTQYSPGETVTCSATGTPPPTFKWVDVDTGATVATTATIQLPTDGSKAYNYRCEASNNPVGGSCSPSLKTIQFSILTTTTTTTTPAPPGVSTTTTVSTSTTSGSTPTPGSSTTPTTASPGDDGWEDIYLIPIILVPLLLLLGCLGCTYCFALWPFGAYRKHRHEHAIVEVAQAEHAMPVRYYPSVDGSTDFSSKYKYWPSPDENTQFSDTVRYGSATGIHTYTAN